MNSQPDDLQEQLIDMLFVAEAYYSEQICDETPHLTIVWDEIASKILIEQQHDGVIHKYDSWNPIGCRLFDYLENRNPDKGIQLLSWEEITKLIKEQFQDPKKDHDARYNSIPEVRVLYLLAVKKNITTWVKTHWLSSIEPKIPQRR